MKNLFKNKKFIICLKILLTLASLGVGLFLGLIGFFILYFSDINDILAYIAFGVIPFIVIPLIWLRGRRKLWLLISVIFAILYAAALGFNFWYIEYDKNLTIDTSPNIKYSDYLPFDEKSKIVRLDDVSLKLTDNLPILDGADAVVPVYAAFINAVYPDDVEIKDGKEIDLFETNNTVYGYRALANKEIDIFFGAYPSKEQREYAESKETEFVYTPIGNEAFVFFVHKDNPINNLTTQQIKDIYSGKITNWEQVGGDDVPIDAYQRNEGSGSQSMLIRFMGDTEIMEPPIDKRNDLMAGIIDDVADYKNKKSSIGFSFRYYVEGIIQNPDIKLISIDGVAPSVKNIKNGSYPIVTPLYAVTYAGNKNKNVEILLNWILSDEGQKIVEETGYAGVNEKAEVDIPEKSVYDYGEIFYFNDFTVSILEDYRFFVTTDDIGENVIINFYYLENNSDKEKLIFSISAVKVEEVKEILKDSSKSATYFSTDGTWVYIEEKLFEDFVPENIFRVNYNDNLNSFQ